MCPALFSFGPFTLHTYGLMVAIGFAAAIVLAWRHARKENIASDIFLDMTLWVIVGGIAGGRIFYVVVTWQDFSGHWIDIIKLWQGGLVFYGGLAGSLLATALYCVKNRLDFWHVLDICAPYAALGHALGRIGCFLNGCCYGLVNTRWGIVFPDLADQRPRLPTQLYESAANLALFGILLFLWRSRPARGSVFAWYVIGYAVLRFALEYLRGDDLRGTFFHSGLSTSQGIALVGLAVGVGLFYRSRPRKCGQ